MVSCCLEGMALVIVDKDVERALLVVPWVGRLDQDALVLKVTDIPVQTVRLIAPHRADAGGMRSGAHIEPVASKTTALGVPVVSVRI